MTSAVGCEIGALIRAPSDVARIAELEDVLRTLIIATGHEDNVLRGSGVGEALWNATQTLNRQI